ncbi:MAG: hypothetical protein JXM70_01485 [Pirellulales bacterium]|nr:hypothetical protein [Pirellulales bacterium]
MLPIFEPVEVFDPPSEHQSRAVEVTRADCSYMAKVVLDGSRMQKAVEAWRQEHGDEIPF